MDGARASAMLAGTKRGGSFLVRAKVEGELAAFATAAVREMPRPDRWWVQGAMAATEKLPCVHGRGALPEHGGQCAPRPLLSGRSAREMGHARVQQRGSL